MAEGERIVVWVPSGDSGWELEASRPYEATAIGGGIRTLYELTAALAAAGRDIELRGVVCRRELDQVCEAACAWPQLPKEPRSLAAGDVVIVPEGIEDPEIHARLALSPARLVLMMLGPPGLIGWPFVSGWSRPDPLTVPLDAVARPEHFRGAAALGYELWTHTPGLQQAAQAAGVPCRFVGNGVPGGYPEPPPEKDIDVLWLRQNRWGPLAAPVIDDLQQRGIRCVAFDEGRQSAVLEQFGRARTLVYPLRIEGHSRVGCEARAMGAVPFVLPSNPFGVGLDEASGSVPVADVAQMADAVAALLSAPDRLAGTSATAIRAAREQVAWGPFVERVTAALDEPAPEPAGPVRELAARAIAGRVSALELELELAHAQRDAAAVALARHQAWLEAVQRSVSWRVTAPLRAGKRRLHAAPPAGGPPRPVPAAVPTGGFSWPAPEAQPARGPFHLGGWCQFPGANVARVEVRVNGGPPQRARIAIERPGDAPDSGGPGAPMCGFEFKADLAELPASAENLVVEALAESLDDRRLVLGPIAWPLGPAADASLPAPLPRHGVACACAGGRGPRPDDGRPLRLLAFTHTLNHSGAALYLLELLRRLSAQTPAIECELVALADGPLRSLHEASGVPVHITDNNSTVSVARYEGHLAELSSWCVAREFDVVLVNTLGAFPGADLARRLGIPAAWVIHESWSPPSFWAAAYPPPLLHPQVRADADLALRDTPALLFVADATRELFNDHADPRRLLTLPYGLETDAIDAVGHELDRTAARRRLGLSADGRTILCLGTVEPRKCQGLLVLAFAEIAERHPDVDLAFVGATQDAYCAGYRAAVREGIARAGLADRIRMEPVTDDPWTWHAAADLVVCASDVESLPRAITEAMAFGTPVLSTRVFGVPELLEDGVQGFLCETGDAADLAAGLERVLSMDPVALAALAERGRAHVRARHDPGVYAATVHRLLQGLAAQPDALPGDLLAAEAVR